jgi:hypothetical protein
VQIHQNPQQPMFGENSPDHQDAAQLQVAADGFLDRERVLELELGHESSRDQQLTDVRNGSA